MNDRFPTRNSSESWNYGPPEPKRPPRQPDSALDWIALLATLGLLAMFALGWHYGIQYVDKLVGK